MNGQSDWPKSHLCPKWPILIGQMRFREVAMQDVSLLYKKLFIWLNHVNHILFWMLKRVKIRRQSTTTEEILIARGFRRQSTTEEMMRCRNFRRQSTQSEELTKTRGRRDSCAQISDGTVATMTVETTAAFYDTSTQTGTQPHPFLSLLTLYWRECERENNSILRVTIIIITLRAHIIESIDPKAQSTSKKKKGNLVIGLLWRRRRSFSC